jgi:flagellar hook assembly protein FlgD
VPGVAHTLKVGFTLSRPASVALQIETKAGAVVAMLPPASLPAGTQSLAWDDRTTSGAPAPPGAYVARVIVTSTVGTMEASGTFALRR